MPDIKTIAVLLASTGYHREVTLGVLGFADTAPGWQVRVFDPEPGSRRAAVRQGIECLITSMHNPEHVEWAVRQNLPIVNISQRLEHPRVPTVSLDNLAIGRLAAEHLVGSGYASFATVGIPSLHFSRQRLQGFREELAKVGSPVAVFEEELFAIPPRSIPRDAVGDPGVLADWLEGLPKPVGIFCHTDHLSRRLVEAVNLLGLGCPDDVGVLGCDNDELLCSQGVPQCSSIDVPGRQVGRAAARCVHRWATQGAPEFDMLLLPPLGVRVRGSTRLIGQHPPPVGRALDFIRQHYSGPVLVDDMARACGVSRRSLEREMRRVLHRSPGEMLNQQRLQVARELLAGTSLPLVVIAEQCGFGDQAQFSVKFKRWNGFSPLAYRRLMSGRG